MKPAQHVIAAFGGVKATARALQSIRDERVWPSTVSRWKRTGYIPPAWHRPILAAAQRECVDVTPAHLVLGGDAE